MWLRDTLWKYVIEVYMVEGEEHPCKLAIKPRLISPR